MSRPTLNVNRTRVSCFERSGVVGKGKGDALPLLRGLDGRFRSRVAFDREHAVWREDTAQVLGADRLRKCELTSELPLHGAAIAVNTRRLGVNVQHVSIRVDEHVVRPEAGHVQL